MIRHLTAFAVGSLVLPGLIVSAQGVPDRATSEKQIAANENAVITAITANDVKTFHSYTVADSYGVDAYHVTKVGDLDPVFKAQHDACKIAKWDILEPTFYWLNDTAVVYIYKIVIDGTCERQKPSFGDGFDGLGQQQRQMVGCIPSAIRPGASGGRQGVRSHP